MKGWGWASSNTGWTNDTLAFNWLEKVFLTSTVPSTPNQRRLLIVDGHDSHVKAGFIACCIQNKIDLMVLPAHSSHITQPLDVGIFAPLKAAMAWQADRWTSLHLGRVAEAD